MDSGSECGIGEQCSNSIRVRSGFLKNSEFKITIYWLNSLTNTLSEYSYIPEVNKGGLPPRSEKTLDLDLI